MGVKYLSQAFAASLPPSEKFVLVALADSANDLTGQCNPSQETLAIKTGFAKRTIIRLIAKLESDGVLTIKRDSRTGNNNYTINPSPTPRRSDTTSSRRSDPVSPHEVTPCHLDEVTLTTPRSDIDGFCEVTLTTPRSDIDGFCEVTLTTPRSDIDDIPYIEEPEENPKENPKENRRGRDHEPEVLEIAGRFAECRRLHAGMKKITKASVDYYAKLIASILASGEVALQDMQQIIDWFETPEGRRSFAYGIGNMPKDHQHALKKNLAMYLAKAKGRGADTSWSSSASAYRGRIQKHNPEEVEPLTEAEFAAQIHDEVPF